jgi:Rrf2 family iron-sulfur cluster assembly transcriptional regulator
MKLTTKGRYAVTAMLDLALHCNNGPVKLAEISERQGISLSYLEQLFTRLRKKGLVKSTRGPGGGYSLSRQSDEIPVSQVILAVDENVDTTRCGGMANCHNDQRCLTHELWTELSNQIRNFLDEITLGELMRNAGVLEVAERQNCSKQDGPVEKRVDLPARA